MRVYLTGFMGSGKSALGRALASELDFEFMDLDAAIESRMGKSISRIFRDDGEPAFRTAEKAALLATATLEDHVIAAGGGTLVPAENMNWALRHGIVIFLDLPVEEIVRRLLRSRRRRPLIQAMKDSPGELERYVTNLLNQRRPSYERAHLCVELERATIGRNAKTLAQTLLRYQAERHTDSPD